MTITQPSATRAVDLLDDELIERCRARAGGYDRDNRFFTEDLTELRDVGYLDVALPHSYGGAGADLADVVDAQRRLASAAPATALALSMHLYFTGGAASLHVQGDTSVDFLLEAAAAGDIIASGHAETGNDMPVLLSTSRAERVDGGYVITGRKRFGSLGPVWTMMGVNALDAGNPEDPRVVHAFVRRDDPHVHVQDQWDTLGMRATQSYDTVLDGVFVPDERVARSLPAGDPTDPFFGAMSTSAFLQFGAVYLGAADRAFELAVASATSKTSIAIARQTMAHHPLVQVDIAEMYTDRFTASTLLTTTARDVTAGIQHPDAPAQVFATKQRVVELAMAIVDRAMDVVGGSSLARGTELERIYRDVTCGRFNGVNRHLATEIIGKAVLGVAPQPRW